jgi:hypothetical protein
MIVEYQRSRRARSSLRAVRGSSVLAGPQPVSEKRGGILQGCRPIRLDAVVISSFLGECPSARGLGIQQAGRFRPSFLTPRVGLAGVSRPRIVLVEELRSVDGATGHEIETNAVFDRLDSGRFVADVVVMLIVGLRERSGRERERWETPVARVDSSSGHGFRDDPVSDLPPSF